MPISRRITSTPWVQKSIGVLGAEYLRLVRNTCSMAIDPPDFYERGERDIPAIVAMWHGQHFMMPFFRRPHDRAKVMISRHRDGEINAIAAERLGLGTVRASRTGARDFLRQRRVGRLPEMLERPGG